MEKTDITTLLEKTEAWILPELESIFDEKEMEDVTVKAAMYSLMAGGKRLRPLMMHLTSEMLNAGPDKEADIVYGLVDFGSAAEILAELEDPCVNSCDDSCEGSVMIIGGDTLLACLRRLGCKDLEPLAELFPGVVLSLYRAGGREKFLISKSGGFGSETLLADLKELIEKKQTMTGGKL